MILHFLKKQNSMKNNFKKQSVSKFPVKISKKMTIILLFVFGFSIITKANTYYDMMLKNIDSLKTVETVEQFTEVANVFELIANNEPQKWLPNYYVADTYILMSFIEEDVDKKDMYLDKAQLFIDKCNELQENNSEIIVLQGFLYQARISVAPMSRGQKFSALATDELQKALAINPDNPRAYYLLGQNILYTPAFFGGGKKNAYPYFVKAKEKYDIFVPETEIAPNWGEQSTLELIDYCNK